MKLLVLDNYDSFVFNLVHIIRELGFGDAVEVIRNDKISLEDVDQYDKILLSPGPGIPVEAGIMMDVIRKYARTKSVLGVCLGHQGICEAFGAELVNMEEVLHGFGLNTTIVDEGEYLFHDVPKTTKTGRYHSWVADEFSIKEPLVITAKSEDNWVMGVRHRDYDVHGVQFHPESILTDNGKKMIQNWLEQ